MTLANTHLGQARSVSLMAALLISFHRRTLKTRAEHTFWSGGRRCSQTDTCYGCKSHC